MNRQQSLQCRTQQLTTIIVLLFIGCVLSIASAGEPIQPVQTDKDFKILYHESLDFQMDSTSGAKSESLAKSAEQENDNESAMMSFDAFGRHFELRLKSNKQLIANLPQQQQDELSKLLQLYRGQLKGNESSWARITREGDRISGMIWDGNEMFVIDHSTDVSKALATNGKPPSDYPLIYRLSDTESDGRSCALAPSTNRLTTTEGWWKSFRKMLVRFHRPLHNSTLPSLPMLNSLTIISTPMWR